MRIRRLFNLVLLISVVFLVMALDMTKSYSTVVKVFSNSVKSIPAAMVYLK